MSATHRFPHTISPIAIRGRELKNRIIFGAHDTNLAKHGRVSDELVAYYEARAANGVAMIVVQAGGIHETSRYIPNLLMLNHDDCIPGLRRVAELGRRHGCRIVGQLHHPGRVWHLPLGVRALAPSELEGEWGKRPVRAMSREDIAMIVAAYAAAARRCVEAGLDGIEIFANHGGLPSQFLNPKVNLRTDEYGGDFANRARFGWDVIDAIRAALGDGILGLRVSVDEMDADTVSADEVGRFCQHAQIDYVSATLGNEQSIEGRRHVVPPMEFPSGYTGAYSLGA